MHATRFVRAGASVVVVSAVRTPIGSFGGALSGVGGPHLAAASIKASLERIQGGRVDVSEVTEAIIGNVISANLGQAPARQASRLAGLKDSTVCTTVNKVCASGMKAVMYGSQSIMLGHHDVVVTGGFESMSNVPYYLEKARTGYRFGHGQLVDGVLRDGLLDAYDGQHMGMCAEKCAKDYGLTRQQQDEYAIMAYKRAAEAWKQGWFKEEVVPITVPAGKGKEMVVAEDEEYKKVNFDKVSSLKPAFHPEGTVTPANASSLNDGASALLLMSEHKARALGLKPLAKILGFADAEQAPVDFTTSPSLAVPKALKNAGVELKDVDFWEVNEAFSVVALANAKILGISQDRLNVHGGGVSLGHPIGSSGARIIVSLIHILGQKNGRLGVASICNGGGGASAIVIEKL
jgi:acetyl-CoA C-acetyltransferase